MPIPELKTARITLAGLRQTATIFRDERGIPYIQAENNADLYFAQGYATASDRLWQMDLMRRTARGELSEIFGRDTLDKDQRRRVYGLARIAKAMMAHCSAPVRLAFRSYARGVNAFIESCNESDLPPEFKLLQYRPARWRPADSHVIGKLVAEMLTTTWPLDLIRAALDDIAPETLNILMPQTSPDDVLICGHDRPQGTTSKTCASPNTAVSEAARAELLSELPSLLERLQQPPEFGEPCVEKLAASNNWVVSGSHTASGKPLLANDPHMPSAAPSTWYLTHLSAPNLRVAGATIPGSPGIIVGHNEYCAWGITNLVADVQDVYVEKFDKDRPGHYLTPAGWREAEVRREKIKVRQNFDSCETETHCFDVKVTRHGPIVFQTASASYALGWTMLDSRVVELEAFLQLNRARNWDEFCAALKDYQGPPQNFVYADVEGHIGYYGAGRIPLRKSNDGSLPFDGSTDEGEWKGSIPFEKLPHDYDPPSGIIATANSRVVGTDYPYYLSRDCVAPYRARRILNLLQNQSVLTADDFLAVQADTYSIPGTLFAREAVRVLSERLDNCEDDKLLEAVGLLDSWNGFVKANSRAALFVLEMRDAFYKRVIKAVLGANRARIYRAGNIGTFIDYLIRERAPEWLPGEFQDYAELLRACAADAERTIEKRLGPDESQWTWGQSVQVKFPHPLAALPQIGQPYAIAPIPQQGSNDITCQTVNAGANVAFRMIADTSDWDKTLQGIAPGQSGNPASVNWADQLEGWRNVAPAYFPFTQSAVARAAQTALRLSATDDVDYKTIA